MPLAVIQHQAAAPDAPVFAPGGPTWQLHPEVARRPRDILIAKRLPGSFTGTKLGEWLAQVGADTVVICGYMTQICCDTTSRQAFHRGLKVEFLSGRHRTLDFANSAGQVSAEELHGPSWSPRRPASPGCSPPPNGSPPGLLRRPSPGA